MILNAEKLFIFFLIFVGLLSVIFFLRNKRKFFSILLYSGKILSGRYKLRFDPRVKKTLHGIFHFPVGEYHTYKTYTYDLSVSGMYIITAVSFKKGDLLQFELNLNDQENIQGLGEVMWTQTEWFHDRPAGVGIRFNRLSFENQEKLNQFMDQELK